MCLASTKCGQIVSETTKRFCFSLTQQALVAVCVFCPFSLCVSVIRCLSCVNWRLFLKLCSLLSLLALLLLFARLLALLAREHAAPMSLHVLRRTSELLDLVAVLLLLLLDDGLDFAVLALLLFALFVLFLELVSLVLLFLQGGADKLKLVLMLAHVVVVSLQSVHISTVSCLELTSQLLFVRFVSVLNFLEFSLEVNDAFLKVSLAHAMRLRLALGSLLALLSEIDLDL